MPNFTVTDPKVFNVQVEDVKQYARISSDADKLVVNHIMLFSEKYIRNECGLSISMVDLVVSISPHEALDLVVPLSPVVSVASVVYKGAPIDPSDYGMTGNVFRCSSRSRDEDVTATFHCGYSSSHDVPADLRLAFMMIVSRVYDNRGGDVNIASLGLLDILRPFRGFRF